MALRIVWRDFDPRIQRLYIASQILESTIDREDRLLGTLTYLLLPETVWHYRMSGRALINSIAEKIAADAELTGEEGAVLRDLEVIHVPDEAFESVEESKRGLSNNWVRVESAFSNVLSKVLGKEPIGEVFVFPVFSVIGREGKVFPPKVLALPAEDVRIDDVVKLLAQAAIEQDKKLGAVIRELEDKLQLPVGPVLGSVVGDLVLWQADRRREMFASYYREEWDAVRELEDKIREIVREWWLNGGDLQKMLRGRLQP